jgi:NADH-quinone oxidoreductase subunit L
MELSVWAARLLVAVVAAPGLVFAALALCWLAGWNPPERFIHRLTSLTYASMAAGLAGLVWLLYSAGAVSLSVPLGDWFHAGGHHFGLLLHADRLSLPMMALCIVLAGVVGAFSVRYLHREPGFNRFFLLLHLFTFGSILVFAAGSLDLLIAGWELVGITSVLLIAFFQERPGPVRSAIYVFAIYRACDLGLLIGVFVLHQVAGSTAFAVMFPGEWPVETTAISGASATAVGLLLLLAASGKSAQVPFSGWLPRAMEGPTPSSAIFYGAISVHAGAYLLLRAGPLWAASTLASAAVVTVGALSAIHATLVGRACADAKTSLAYASMAQLGLIFVEIGLGFDTLALFHIIGHATVRTLEFLRAPSMLHDFHHVHAAAGGRLDPAGSHYEALLPEHVRLWLYRLALDRGHHDTILDRFVLGPVVRLARRAAAVERRLSAQIAGRGEGEPPLPAFLGTASEQQRSGEVSHG